LQRAVISAAATAVLISMERTRTGTVSITTCVFGRRQLLQRLRNAAGDDYPALTPTMTQMDLVRQSANPRRRLTRLSALNPLSETSRMRRRSAAPRLGRAPVWMRD